MVIMNVFYAIWEVSVFHAVHILRLIVVLLAQQIAFWVTYLIGKRIAEKKEKPFKAMLLCIIPPVIMVLFHVISFFGYLFLLGMALTS